MKQWLKIAAILLVASLLFAGCGTLGKPLPEETKEEAPPAPAPAPEPVVVRTPVIGARQLEDGRMVGGTAKGRIGDDMINVFFSFSVDKADLAHEYEGNAAERGYVYLVAELTLTNAFDGPLPIWSSDFLLQWGEGANDYGYPIDQISKMQFDDAFSLAREESLTKHAVYEVPVYEGKKEFVISYQEYYEDGTEGNTFYIIFDLSM